MTPIPRAAAPVVWFIRWWVKKPRRLPSGMPLRWWDVRVTCPLGRLPFADRPFPYLVASACLEGHGRAFHSFYRWWDSQTDARAAVDAVWGKG